MAGWTWEKKDTDGDGAKDDIRVKDNGAGVIDLKNGAQGSGLSSGTAHDGNVAYPSNQIGTWSR